MATSVLYMSMSVDGFIAGPDDSVANPGGDGFMRLHAWMVGSDGEFGRPVDESAQLWDGWAECGAIVAGRRTVEQADHWGGDNHGVPIFVVSHRPPGPTVATYPKVTYVDNIVDAMTRARAAAGDREVLMHGAASARHAIEAGVLDEIVLHQVPVLFGGGLRLFDALTRRTELEIVRVIDTPRATHIRYRLRYAETAPG